MNTMNYLILKWVTVLNLFKVVKMLS